MLPYCHHPYRVLARASFARQTLGPEFAVRQNLPSPLVMVAVLTIFLPMLWGQDNVTGEFSLLEL
jgi:hypothetical protein